MKKFFKVLFIIFLFLLVGIGGFLLWINFSKTPQNDTMIAVPSDAVFIIETENITKAIKEINNNKIWRDMSNTRTIKQVDSTIAAFSSLLNTYKPIKRLLANRPMLFSVHILPNNDYRLLFSIDLQKASKLKAAAKILNRIEGYNLSKTKVNNNDLFKLTNENNNRTVWFTVEKNLLLLSFDRVMVEKALNTCQKPYWTRNINYLDITEKLNNKELFNCYVNYQYFNKFLAIFFRETPDLVPDIANYLDITGLECKINDEMLEFQGFTCPDSMPSYLKSLSKIKPAKIKSYNLIPQHTASFVSINFESYYDYLNTFFEEVSANHPVTFKKYSDYISQNDNFLNMNIREELYSWAGHEISQARFGLKYGERAEETAVFINTIDTQKAHDFFITINNKVKSNKESTFKTETYKDFNINYLEYRDIFEIYFGKLFKSINKPFYTIIDDYVIFCNSITSIKMLIDNYLSENTLGKDKNFGKFINQFDEKSSFVTYIQSPVIYPNLYYFGQDDYKPAYKRNKELIYNMSQWGFQLIGGSGIFTSKLIINYDSDTYKNELLSKETSMVNF